MVLPLIAAAAFCAGAMWLERSVNGGDEDDRPSGHDRQIESPSYSYEYSEPEPRSSGNISSSDYFSRKKAGKAKAKKSHKPQQERRLPLDSSYDNEVTEYRGVPIINRGDGDINKAKRVIDRVASQAGYGEDFRRHIKSVTIQHRLKHDDGSHVCGWNHVGHVGISTRDSDGDVESHLKHELGHATHGSPEWAAERYEHNHF